MQIRAGCVLLVVLEELLQLKESSLLKETRDFNIQPVQHRVRLSRGQTIRIISRASSPACCPQQWTDEQPTQPLARQILLGRHSQRREVAAAVGLDAHLCQSAHHACQLCRGGGVVLVPYTLCHTVTYKQQQLAPVPG